MKQTEKRDPREKYSQAYNEEFIKAFMLKYKLIIIVTGAFIGGMIYGYFN